MKRLANLVIAVVLGALGSPSAGHAQTVSFDVPRSTVFPNYDRMPLGQREGLEGGAFVARTDDANAAWYNPAGLVQSKSSGLNASANAYEWTTLEIEGLGTKTSLSRLNSLRTLVSGVIGAPILTGNWRPGFAIARPVSWRPGSLDDVVEYTSPGVYERFTYEAVSDFSTEVWRAAVGWRVAPKLRMGAGLGLARTSLSLNQATTNHLVRGDSANTVTRRLFAEGSDYHLVPTVGLQWDLHARWRVGLRGSAPGWRVTGSSLLDYGAIVARSSFDATLAIRDDAADFEYKVPAEVAVGLAYQADRAEVEADARWHAGTPTYDLYWTNALGTLTIDTADQPADVQEASFTPTEYEARSVLNLALGGRYRLTRTWSLHAGFFTDQSPVAASSGAFFPRIDFAGGSVGVSFTGSHLSGALGVGLTSGRSDELPIGTTLGGESVTGRFKVSTIGVNYAVSYAF